MVAHWGLELTLSCFSLQVATQPAPKRSLTFCANVRALTSFLIVCLLPWWAVPPRLWISSWRAMPLHSPWLPRPHGKGACHLSRAFIPHLLFKLSSRWFTTHSVCPFLGSFSFLVFHLLWPLNMLNPHWAVLGGVCSASPVPPESTICTFVHLLVPPNILSSPFHLSLVTFRLIAVGTPHTSALLEGVMFSAVRTVSVSEWK